ncbi:MAG: hypothetical protein CM1200mP30_12600 [Pseudomonadota bacterium]|nr:MAG: hypothetical protein CM1200mP30_12600 [Pseudomonadota bacterium]
MLKTQRTAVILCVHSVLFLLQEDVHDLGKFSNLQDEARLLISEGVREIVITGVNIGTYKTEQENIIGVVDFLNNPPGTVTYPYQFH